MKPDSVLNIENYKLVEDCEIRQSRLSEWEQGFISSIAQAIDEGRRLSQKQQETLLKIWEKCTEEG